MSEYNKILELECDSRKVLTPSSSLFFSEKKEKIPDIKRNIRDAILVSLNATCG